MIKKLINHFKRAQDFIVGGADNPYLLRWWIIPRNKYFNIYLHKFLRDDDDRALHDHPWVSLSIILKNGYIEHLPNGKRKYYDAGCLIFRRALHRHRIQLWTDHSSFHEEKKRPVWTIFITGPRIREWGFWCEGIRFVPWEKFTSPVDKGDIGKGCAE